jgi:hypothetical protein
MKSDYKGIGVIRMQNGSVSDVQVEDPCGNSIPLSLNTYIEREIKPPYTSLPDYKKESILPNMNTSFAVSNTNIPFQGKSYKIVHAGIKDGHAFVKLSPYNEKVASTIIGHIEAHYKNSISLEEIIKELNA